VEGLGGLHRVLAGHGVDDQERVVGLDLLGDVPDLAHQLLVDGQAAGGVHDDHVPAEAGGLLHARLGHLDGVLGLAEDGDVDGRAEGAELLDGGRTLEIRADQQRVAALLLEPAGQLGRGRGLAGALEAGEQHDGRGLAGVGELEGLAAEGDGELLVDDLDDLLGRAEALADLGPDGPDPDPLDEVPGHGQGDVGLEQGDPDLLEDLVDVGLGELALAPEALEDPVEAVRKRLEHEPPILRAVDPRATASCHCPELR